MPSITEQLIGIAAAAAAATAATPPQNKQLLPPWISYTISINLNIYTLDWPQPVVSTYCAGKVLQEASRFKNLHAHQALVPLAQLLQNAMAEERFTEVLYPLYL